jgi:pimeloyl-ACP methyl ester carboxylesterase
MRRRLALTAAATLTLAAIAASLLLVLARPGAVADPKTARCNDPGVRVVDWATARDRDEVALRFTCAGATLAATLTLPLGPGPHPAAVWVHGAGEASRLTYRGAPLVRALVGAGVAVLSYDKRGVGESEGACCPGDSGHFNLLAADAAGALHVLAARPDIDPTRLGFIGASQAGWVVPLAVARSGLPVRFSALADAPVVSQGEERLYSHLTGEEGGQPSALPMRAILDRVHDEGPSGFQPLPFLRAMTGSSLWLYGGRDRSQPSSLDVAILTRLRADGLDTTFRVFPDAGHGLLDVPATDPAALPTLVTWVRATVRTTPATGSPSH